MGRAKNTLSTAEVSSTPIKVRYSATYASNSLADYGITVTRGTNYTYNVSMDSASFAEMTTYRGIKQLYYQYAIIGSGLNSASAFVPTWQSTAASGTYDANYYDFPTQLTGSFLVFAVPSRQFGEQIGRKTFSIASTGSGTQFKIVDDGNGNLIDSLASNTFVGNIFYAQGVAVITNPGYTTPGDEYLVTEADEFLITEDPDNDNLIIE